MPTSLKLLLFNFLIYVFSAAAEEQAPSIYSISNNAKVLFVISSTGFRGNVTLEKRTKDRRIQKTEALLREALTSLIREKAYDSIVVKEILDRANVGRSTFYTHYRDKDELLSNTIYEILHAAESTQLPNSARTCESIIRFSLPILKYIEEHRRQHARAHNEAMNARSRAILHEHLQDVIAQLISDDVERYLKGHKTTANQIPPVVLINYVASTFVQLLNWWLETNSHLTPTEVNDLFRKLVVPTLSPTFEHFS